MSDHAYDLERFEREPMQPLDTSPDAPQEVRGGPNGAFFNDNDPTEHEHPHEIRRGFLKSEVEVAPVDMGAIDDILKSTQDTTRMQRTAQITELVFARYNDLLPEPAHSLPDRSELELLYRFTNALQAPAYEVSLEMLIDDTELFADISPLHVAKGIAHGRSLYPETKHAELMIRAWIVKNSGIEMPTEYHDLERKVAVQIARQHNPYA